MNEYGWPHLVQKPSVRPGRSPRLRPTGAPQSPLLQNRFRSGTCGSCSTEAAGSGRGIGGTATSPAPSLLRVGPLEPERELRTDTGFPPTVLPLSERDSRPDTERREEREVPDEREDREEGADPDEPSCAAPVLVLEPEPDPVLAPGAPL